MNATELAEMAEAARLVQEYGLCTKPCDHPETGWAAFQWLAPAVDSARGEGETFVSAVRAWAESAGVPWEPPQVVEMYAYIGDQSREVCTVVETAEQLAETEGGHVVPCVVVIPNESEPQQ